MKNKTSQYLIEGLSSAINEMDPKCVGIILSIEGGPTILIDKATTIQARKYGDKVCFNYLSSAGQSISRSRYDELSQAEEFYLEIKIEKK